MSSVELGRLEGARIGTVRSVVQAFGLSYEGLIRGLGADADRVLDQRHATILGGCATWLNELGWQTTPEVTYSEWGERGSVDILAWHQATRTLLVIEVKTELASIEETLRKHDEKVRLAPKIAQQFGWRPSVVARLLVLPAQRTQYRRVADHAPVLTSAYPMRTRAVRAWCRKPNGPLAGLLFVPKYAGSRPMVGRVRRQVLPAQG